MKSNHVVQSKSNRVVLVGQVNVLPSCVIPIVVEGENLLEKKKNIVASTYNRQKAMVYKDLILTTYRPTHSRKILKTTVPGALL